MDPYTELKYNFEGIKDTLLGYSRGGILFNDVQKLDKALDENDLDAVKYFLNKLCEWYEENLGVIITSKSVYNKEEHRKSSRLLKELNPKIKLIASLEPSNKTLDKNCNNSTLPIFFISHKSDDADFGNIIRQLLLNIGIKNNQIIFTSNPMNKIPFGENIYDYLRQKITQDTYVIYLISDNYFSSSACLNEMGASWVMQNDNAKLFLPNFNHQNAGYLSCCIDKSEMGITLNGDLHCKEGLVSMMKKVKAFANIDSDIEELNSFVDLTCEELKNKD